MLDFGYLTTQPKKQQNINVSIRRQINIDITDVELILKFGHPKLQLKFNQISTSYDIVCLLGI